MRRMNAYLLCSEDRTLQGKSLKVRELIKLLEEAGWVLARTRGSHRQFKYPRKVRNCHSSGQAERRRAAGDPKCHT
jgi:hypothetical protein